MAIILDADVIIRGEKGTFDLKTWVSSRPDDSFEIAAITVAELWHGVERATRAHKTRRRQYLETILNSLPILPYTEQTAYEHACLWAKLEASGKMIGFYDRGGNRVGAWQRSGHVQFQTLHSGQGVKGDPTPVTFVRHPAPGRGDRHVGSVRRHLAGSGRIGGRGINASRAACWGSCGLKSPRSGALPS